MLRILIYCRWIFFFIIKVISPNLLIFISDKLEAEEAAVMAEIEEDGEELDEDEEMEEEEGKFICPMS